MDPLCFPDSSRRRCGDFLSANPLIRVRELAGAEEHMRNEKSEQS
jgi:hypothetical protein